MKEKGVETKENKELSDLVEKLSPLEIKIIPFLKDEVAKICKKAEMDEVSVVRALHFLEAKDILKTKSETKSLIELGTNGVYYKKNNLPERKLLIVLETNNHIPLEEDQKLSKLSENEFRVSLGILKSKALITLANGKLSMNASREELTKKFLEEQFLDILPIEKDKLVPEQLYAFENLKKRKDSRSQLGKLSVCQ